MDSRPAMYHRSAHQQICNPQPSVRPSVHQSQLQFPVELLMMMMVTMMSVWTVKESDQNRRLRSLQQCRQLEIQKLFFDLQSIGPVIGS